MPSVATDLSPTQRVRGTVRRPRDLEVPRRSLGRRRLSTFSTPQPRVPRGGQVWIGPQLRTLSRAQLIRIAMVSEFLWLHLRISSASGGSRDLPGLSAWKSPLKQSWLTFGEQEDVRILTRVGT